MNTTRLKARSTPETRGNVRIAARARSAQRAGGAAPHRFGAQPRAVHSSIDVWCAATTDARVETDSRWNRPLGEFHHHVPRDRVVLEGIDGQILAIPGTF